MHITSKKYFWALEMVEKYTPINIQDIIINDNYQK